MSERDDETKVDPAPSDVEIELAEYWEHLCASGRATGVPANVFRRLLDRMRADAALRARSEGLLTALTWIAHTGREDSHGGFKLLTASEYVTHAQEAIAAYRQGGECLGPETKGLS
ncbi:hypothetical protein [Ancylobacter defluvii]|uniref:Uncharacterized protein n=1 Tax=Ancylobacter defluvii TaxID=1282440 RepID=A0A9W6K053_9HYPH|nr:hypothetical protein [Ancylobacter defluvii]MBS7586432.1 hypothetical protein [Ancylobacter defluvii]GLK85713.1 hypothetical protein GCM10017653_37830 [Ancylobacter defluvii]